MTCPARAKFAAILARLGLARRACVPSEPSTGPRGPAANTSTVLTPTGKPILTPETLYRRGLMQNNRNPEAAEKYAERNLILVKGR
jgi:hypothetical protein